MSATTAARGVRDHLGRLAKFGLVGATGTGVNMATFWLLTSVGQLHYLAAAALAIELALCTNYLLNNNWTFADRRDGFASRRGFARYHLVSLGGMAINLTVLQLLAGVVGVPPLLANILGIGVATGWTFSLNLSWTWRRAAHHPLAHDGIGSVSSPFMAAQH